MYRRVLFILLRHLNERVEAGLCVSYTTVCGCVCGPKVVAKPKDNCVFVKACMSRPVMGAVVE